MTEEEFKTLETGDLIEKDGQMYCVIKDYANGEVYVEIVSPAIKITDPADWEIIKV